MTQAEPFSLRVAPHLAGIRVEVHGVGTYENTVACWQTIVAEIKARQPKGLLLIDEMRGPPLSAAQWQALVAAMAGQGLESVRIAHVRPQGLQLIEHCEIYAREAGLDARVFVNEATADLWLRHGEH